MNIKYKPYCILRITDYRSSIGGEHFYGKLDIINEPVIPMNKAYMYGSLSPRECIEITRELKEDEYWKLECKDSGKYRDRVEWTQIIEWGLNVTNRFNTIKQLEQCVLKEYNRLGLDKTHGLITLYKGEWNNNLLKIKCLNYNCKRSK